MRRLLALVAALSLAFPAAAFARPLLGVHGAVDRFDQLTGTIGDDFFVLNGDLLTDLDFATVMQRHRESGAVATVSTFSRTETYTSRYDGPDERYRVTFNGRFLVDGAVGTLRARMVWREPGERRRRGRQLSDRAHRPPRSPGSRRPPR